MGLFAKVKAALARPHTSRPAPLGPISPREEELVASLRARLQTDGASPTPPAEVAENEWIANLSRLRQLVQDDDPRDFLNWDVIRSTMFVAEEPYIEHELAYLQGCKDWATRWEPSIREWAAGNPQPYSKFPSSSGNLIHHAYHVARFENATGVRVSEMDLVIEFGGGYGSMRRLFENLGFRGRYVINDFPEFTHLQDYYLRSGGTGEGSTVFTTGIKELLRVVDAEPDGRALLIGTWSISEAPIELRQALVPVGQRCDAQLLGYQTEFSGVDNVGFFSEWECQFADFSWHDVAIDHIPDNRYAFGIKAST